MYINWKTGAAYRLDTPSRDVPWRRTNSIRPDTFHLVTTELSPITIVLSQYHR